MKVERKIASRETTSVRKLKGQGSIYFVGRTVLAMTHTENQMTCTQTKAIEPQNRVIQSAIRSADDCWACAARSRSAMDFTFCAVSSSTVFGR